MDPFSAASGVAGLLSLGITVCKGLHTYCRDYRSKDDDIHLLSQHAERLEAFLQMIDSRLNTGGQVDLALKLSLDECYSACNTCIQDFNTLSTKYSQASTTRGFREHGKAVMQHIQYPFQKDRFNSLRIQMQEFHTAFSSCLLILNRDLTSEVLETTISESTKLASAILLQGQKTTDQISALLPAIDQAINHRLAQYDQSWQERFRCIESFNAHDFHKGGREISSNVTEVHMSTEPRRRCDQAAPHEEPPLVVASSSDQCSSPNALLTMARTPMRHGTKERQLGVTTKSSFLHFGCNCKHVVRQAQMRLGGFEELCHENACPFSYLNRNSRKITGEIRALGRLFRWKIGVRYSRSVFLQDLQIQPNITIRTVRDNSPAVDKVMALAFAIPFQAIKAEKNLEEHVSLTVTALQQLFTDRKAWPTDIDSIGRGLFDVLFLFLDPHKVQFTWSERSVYNFIQFIKALVLMGVPINDGGRFGTPLHQLLTTNGHPPSRDGDSQHGRLDTTSYMAKEFMELGALYSEPNGRDCRSHDIIDIDYMLALPRIYQDFTDSLHSFDYGELSGALFRRSESDVRRLLSIAPDLILEKGHYNQTSLHIAVLWIKGLELLFDLAPHACRDLMESPDSSGLRPVDYAIALHQGKSLTFLLNRRAIIHLGNAIDCSAVGVFHHNNEQSLEICDILSKELASRRKEILQYAIQKLPPQEVTRLGLSNMVMLQGNESEVLTVLENNDIELPHFECLRRCSVYHTTRMTTTLAEALFQAGFYNIDSVADGHTPLMTICRDTYAFKKLEDKLKLIMWFEEKGANFRMPIRIKPHTPVSHGPGFEHRVIHRLSYFMGVSTAYQDYFEIEFLPLMLDIFRISPKGPCLCYCALEGCSPISVFVRGWIRSYRWSTGSDDSNALVFPSILAVLSLSTPKVQAAFTRAFTFARLGMRHTCCSHSVGDSENVFNYPDEENHCDLIISTEPAEVAEIREEDRHLAVILDELMEEFSSRLQDRTQSFGDFWESWEETMNEIELEEDSITSEDVEAMLDIGVRFENV